MKYVIIEKFWQGELPPDKEKERKRLNAFKTSKSLESFIDKELQKEREKDPLHPMHRRKQSEKTLGEAVSKPLHENIRELVQLQERGKHLDKLLAEQRKETWTRTRRGKTETVHRRKPRGMIKVRNPNPHGETFIWVKPVKAEKVRGFVPEGTKEHLD